MNSVVFRVTTVVADRRVFRARGYLPKDLNSSAPFANVVPTRER